MNELEKDQLIRRITAINCIYEKVISCRGEEELAKTCLNVAEKLVGAKFGFFGEINKEGGFDDLGISNPGWDECQIPKSEAVKLIKNMKIRGMQFLPLTDGISRIFNDPANHSNSVGVPEGHPEITCLLSVPLWHKKKMIGMIGLGNKVGGFEQSDLEAIEQLSVAIVAALMRERMVSNGERKMMIIESIDKKIEEYRKATDHFIEVINNNG